MTDKELLDKYYDVNNELSNCFKDLHNFPFGTNEFWDYLTTQNKVEEELYKKYFALEDELVNRKLAEKRYIIDRTYRFVVYENRGVKIK